MLLLLLGSVAAILCRIFHLHLYVHVKFIDSTIHNLKSSLRRNILSLLTQE